MATKSAKGGARRKSRRSTRTRRVRRGGGRGDRTKTHAGTLDTRSGKKYDRYIYTRGELSKEFPSVSESKLDNAWKQYGAAALFTFCTALGAAALSGCGAY
jgi:hypothetical protein